MKICAISFHCCPFSLLGGDGTGGMNVYLRELCDVTAHFPGIKIDVFTRIQNPKIKGIKYFSPQARVVHLKGGPESPMDRTRLYDFLPEFYQNMKNFVLREREKYDIFYSHYWLSGLVGERLKREFNMPLVHIFHTLAFMKKRFLKGDFGEDRNRLKAEQHLSHVVDAIVSLSREEMQNLSDEYGIPSSKIKIIHPGVNEKLFYPHPGNNELHDLKRKTDGKILLYVGRIDPAKGLMNLIDAIGLLKEREEPLFNKLKLFVIGGGRRNRDLLRNREFIRIEESIKEKRLSEKVVFLGSIEQSHLRKYYSAADVLVMPSLYESFGLAAVEALACGTPVIVSQIGGMRFVVQEGKNGFSFRPNGPSSLSRVLEYFCSHQHSLWKREKIRRHVLKRFSWVNTVEETYSFFEEILGRKSSLTTISQPGESPQPV